MSKCEYCKREMTTAKGCRFTEICIGGTWYPRIRAGMPGDLGEGFYEKKSDRCHDCGARYGEPHHPGCDNERCPVCGRQSLMCGCDVTGLRYER